jgi:hypothetical protein
MRKELRKRLKNPCTMNENQSGLEPAPLLAATLEGAVKLNRKRAFKFLIKAFQWEL